MLYRATRRRSVAGGKGLLPLILALTALAGCPGFAQDAGSAAASSVPSQPESSPEKTGVAFWDIPDRMMNAMLASPPWKEAQRYARLRQSFEGAGCRGDALSDLVLRGEKNHPILLCTLAGVTPERIVVTANLTARNFFNGPSDGWADAAILPMLYHALRAQPRHATFVFAALNGDHGDTDFENHLEAGGATAPLGMVSLYGIGFGMPEFSNVQESDLDARVRANAVALQVEAGRMLMLLRMGATHDPVRSAFSPENTIRLMAIRDGPKDLPHITFYSNAPGKPNQLPQVTVAAFHEDFDYLAFYLADIDGKLNAPAR